MRILYWLAIAVVFCATCIETVSAIACTPTSVLDLVLGLLCTSVTDEGEVWFGFPRLNPKWMAKPNLSAFNVPWDLYLPDTLSVLPGLLRITTVDGSLFLQDTSLVTSLVTILLTTVTGNVTIANNAAVTSLSYLANISVGGSLIVKNNPKLGTLDGIHNSVISGDVYIGMNPAMNALNMNLQSITGQLTIENMVSSIPVTLNSLASVSGIRISNTQFTSLSMATLSIVTGDVTVANNPKLTSLGTFTNLKNITGALTLTNNSLLASMTGLPALTSLRSLSITQCNALTSIAAFTSVKSVVSSITVSQNNLLSSLSAFNGLSSLTGSLTITNNPALVSITNMNISSIGGSLVLSGNTLLNSASILSLVRTIGGSVTLTSLPALVGGGTGLLTSIGGGVTMTGLTSFTTPLSVPSLVSIGGSVVTDVTTTCSGVLFALGMTLPPCQKVTGSVSVLGVNSLPLPFTYVQQVLGGLTLSNLLSNTLSLPLLTTVAGGLTVNNNSLLSSLNLLSGLTSVSGSITITNNGALTSLTGLVLTSVTGTLTVSSNSALATFLLSTLNTVSGSLILTSLSSVTSISLPNLSTVSGDLQVVNVTASSFYAPALTVVGGALTLTSNPLLSDISTLSNLLQVGSALTVSACPALMKLNQLSSLRNVSASLSIVNNTLLSTIHFMSLAHIGGLLSVTSNPNLFNLTGFPALVSTAGVQLTLNALLATVGADSFSALHSVLGDLTVSNNPILTTLQSFSALTHIDGTLSIASNPQLRIVSAFNQLNSCQSIGILDNAALLQCGATSSVLSVVSHNVAVQNNPLLTQLPLFAQVVAVDGDLALDSNKALQTLSGSFNGLTLVGGSLSVTGNDNLQELFAIRSLLQSVRISVTIENNVNLCLDPLAPFSAINGNVTELNNYPVQNSMLCTTRLIQVAGNATALPRLNYFSSGQLTDYLATSSPASLGSALDGVQMLSGYSAAGALTALYLTNGTATLQLTSALGLYSSLMAPSILSSVKSLGRSNSLAFALQQFVSGLSVNQPCGRSLISKQTNYFVWSNLTASVSGQSMFPSPGNTVTMGSTFDSEVLVPASSSLGQCFSCQLVFMSSNPFVSTISSQQIDSNVFSLDMGQLEVSNLTSAGALQFTLSHISNAAPPAGQKRVCAYWSVSSEQWLQDGCTVVSSSNTSTSCRCNHFTNFAVLFDTDGSTTTLSSSETKVLEAFTYIGCILSMIGCVIFLLTFTVLGKLRTGPIALIMHLAVAIFCTDLIFLVGIDQTSNAAGCEAVAILLYYFLMASFCLMGCIGHNMWTGFSSNTWRRKFTLYFILGWGLPFVMMMIVLIVEHTTNHSIGLGDESRCWISTKYGLVGAFLIPVGIVILINTCVFLRSTYVLYQSRQVTARLSSKDHRASQNKQHLIVSVTLMVSLGLTWIFGYLAVITNQSGFYYPFVIFNSLQGFLLCVTYCFRSRVVTAWQDHSSARKAAAASKTKTTDESVKKPSRPDRAHMYPSDISSPGNSRISLLAAGGGRGSNSTSARSSPQGSRESLLSVRSVRSPIGHINTNPSSSNRQFGDVMAMSVIQSPEESMRSLNAVVSAYAEPEDLVQPVSFRDTYMTDWTGFASMASLELSGFSSAGAGTGTRRSKASLDSQLTIDSVSSRHSAEQDIDESMADDHGYL